MKAAQDEVRQAALDSGRQVFTGVVKCTSFGERTKERVPGLTESYDAPLVVLDFEQVQISANNGDGQGWRRQAGDSLSLGEDVGAWAALDGKTVTVAAYACDLWWPSDIMGALYSVTGSSVLLYAEDGSPASNINTQLAQSEYLLPESGMRIYSASELEALDTYELFIARNEIYARHSREFTNQELRDYFGLKTWYTPMVAPGDFQDSWLSETERANVNAILDIERRRNSPYLS